MRMKFFLIRCLPLFLFLSLIYLIKNDIYLNDEKKIDVRSQSALYSDKTSLTKIKIKISEHNQLFLNLNLTTLNLESYAYNCKAESNESKIFVGLMSKVDSFKRRSIIRNTLLKQVNASKQKLLFFVAKSNDSSINDQVDEESLEFNDIIKLEFIESYYNLTLKTISFLEYFNRFCNEYKYAIKLDDDVFVNWHGLKSYLDQEVNNTNPTIYGKVWTGAKVNRDPSKKWYVDRNMYSSPVFPVYCSGASYIYNKEAVQQVIEQHQKMKNKIFYLEDVYSTGILALKTKIKFKNVSQLITKYIRNGKELFIKNYLKKKILLMHPVTDLVYNSMYRSIMKTYKL